MSLWSPCGLYANLPYGYEYASASTNFINPTYDGIKNSNDASANLNDFTFSNNFDNNTGGISDIPSVGLVTPTYSSVVTSSHTMRPPTRFNLTTESTDDQAISTIDINLPNEIPANSSLSKR